MLSFLNKWLDHKNGDQSTCPLVSGRAVVQRVLSLQPCVQCAALWILMICWHEHTGVPWAAPLGMGGRTQAQKELWSIITCKTTASLGICNPLAAILQRATLFFSLIQPRLLLLKKPNNTVIFVWTSRDSGMHIEELKSVVILPHFRDEAHDCFSFTSTAQANQCWSGVESARVAKDGGVPNRAAVIALRVSTGSAWRMKKVTIIWSRNKNRTRAIFHGLKPVSCQLSRWELGHGHATQRLPYHKLCL